ncbi:MAG TPA: dienelactone hydrolase family protein [Pyrinomonadaceae bacterium]|nr:dienelactone hydrolase family protein [Pyrinomonadaceae bacterium]
MCLSDNCDDGRRKFVVGAAGAIVSVAVARALGQANYPHNYPPVTRVLDSPTITHGSVIFKHGGQDSIDGFLARPKADGRYPGVVVIPGNVITEEYIPNTCAALAVAGFVGLAPNIFHTLPANARTPEERRLATAAHVNSDCLLDIMSGMDYLRTQPFIKPDGFGVVGFCFGGHLAMMLGSRSRELDAVVAYHPGPTIAAEINRLTAPVLIHQGTADRNVPVAQIKQLEKTLRAQKTPVEVNWYEGADHGFLAYTRPYYRPDHGKLSWERTVAFLNKHLKRKA